MILPLQITCVIVLLVVAGTYRVLRRSRKVAPAAQLAAATGVVAVVPILFLVSGIVDSFRYGVFRFERAAEIGDPHVLLPESATGITLHKFGSGHEVRFTIDPPGLASWMESVANRRRDQLGQPTPFQEQPKDGHGDLRDFENEFGRNGWTMPADVVRYRGWRWPTGAGFDVWYSPSTQEGYIRAGYW